jgi:hypothetical protein
MSADRVHPNIAKPTAPGPCRARQAKVDVLVAEGSHVEMSGGVVRGDLLNAVPAVPEQHRHNVIRVRGHSLFGDVTARIAEHTHPK